ncbi:MAG: HEAT repeat domain-containing protein, partial [Myxococcota bacterium]|nr:HEAT repeat domain-containing protein [Myxococcota bacterium]
IIVADHTPPETRPVDLEGAADKALRKAFVREDRFRSAVADDAGACAMEVKTFYGLMVNGELRAAGDQGQARLVMEAEAHCPTRGKSAGEVETYRVTVQNEEAFSNSEGIAAVRALVDPLSEQLAATVYGQLIVRHASDEAVVTALSEGQPAGLLMEAAAEAGERKLVAAVPRLVALTEHPDEVVALRAGAALGLIGLDGEGVISALARMTEGPNPEPHLIAVHAMGDIGGPRAARYLDALAVGHPEAVIRQAAREAAKRAKQTKRNADTDEATVHDAPP